MAQDRTWADVVQNTRKYHESIRFPDKANQRSRENMLFPAISPRFSLAGVHKIFTIGSCFARNIEEKLHEYDLPTMRFRPPKEEYLEGRANALLNEYNPGTMSRRILNAVGTASLPDDTIVGHEAGCIDLLLPHGVPVSRERAFERRQEITTLYAELRTSDVVIITLGLIEAWYDKATEAYLNRLPPRDTIRAQPDRYILRQLDTEDAFPLLDQAVAPLAERQIKVLLTVSPVPLQTTLIGTDAVVANCYSKSVLRICAQRLCVKYPLVDYFPSYEIVMSGGLRNFHPDQVHVLDEVVGHVTDYMIKTYIN